MPDHTVESLDDLGKMPKKIKETFELLMDGMRDKVSAINQRVHALSDDFDVLLPNDDPAAQS